MGSGPLESFAPGTCRNVDWQGHAANAPSAPEASRQRSRITIAAAVKVFLSNREGAKIAPSTLRKYRTFTNQLTAFADGLGYIMLDQLASGDIDVFYSQMGLGARAKAKRLGTLRAFFRFCVNRKWLPESPVSADIKPPVGANRVANKAPFTAKPHPVFLCGSNKNISPSRISLAVSFITDGFQSKTRSRA